MSRASSRVYAFFWATLFGVAGLGAVGTAIFPESADEGRVAPRALLISIAVMSTVFAAGYVIALIPSASRIEIDMRGEEIVGLRSWFMTIEGCRLTRDTFLGADTELAAPIALVPRRRCVRWTVVEPGRLVAVRRWPMRLCSAAMGLRSPWLTVAVPDPKRVCLLPDDAKRIVHL